MQTLQLQVQPTYRSFSCEGIKHLVVAVHYPEHPVLDWNAHIMDLTNLAEPQIAGTYPTAQPVRDVAITEDVVLLVVGALPTGISRSQGGGEVLVLRQTR